MPAESTSDCSCDGVPLQIKVVRHADIQLLAAGPPSSRRSRRVLSPSRDAEVGRARTCNPPVASGITLCHPSTHFAGVPAPGGRSGSSRAEHADNAAVATNYFDQLMRGKFPSELESMHDEYGSPRLQQNPGAWLPLPASLANSFPWVLDAPGAESMPLHRLAEPEVVKLLDKRLRRAYEDAIRRRLREPLRARELPLPLLQSPVCELAQSEIRFHLSRNGVPRHEQPETLRIADALGFIGRRANRLLQCASKTASFAPALDRGLGIEFIVVDSVILGLEPGEKLGQAFRKTKRISANPFALSHQLQAPSAWRKLRSTANASVAVLLEDGHLVTARDPRFGWALMRIHGLVHLAGEPLNAVRLRVASLGNESLTETTDWLIAALQTASASTTANETRDLIEAILPRNEEKAAAGSILAGRYGLDGQDLTLEQCAEPIGLTRERVRQLQSAFEGGFEDYRPYAPALARFASHLEGMPLISIRVFASEYAQLLGGQTAIGAFAAARAVLGRPADGWLFDQTVYPPYNLRLSCWSTRLVQRDLVAILRSARAMVTKVGAFHVTTVCGDVGDELKAYISLAEVEGTIDSCEQFTWIDRETGWGTLGDAGDASVFNEVRKMLAVAFPISLDVSEIVAGLVACRRQVMKRDNAGRFGGAMPPPWVIRKLLELQPDLQIAQYDNFKLKQALDPEILIHGEAEKLIFKTLMRLGGAASWRELRQELLDTRAMNPITFGVVLKSSSIFCQPGYGIYALRGWRFNIESLWGKHGQKTFPRPAAQGAVSLGGSDSELIVMDVNQTATKTARRSHRIVYVPSGALPRATGTYLHEDDPSLRIRISPRGQIARLANELTDNGIQPRETVRLRLNTAIKTYAWERKSYSVTSLVTAPSGS